MAPCNQNSPFIRGSSGEAWHAVAQAMSFSIITASQALDEQSMMLVTLMTCPAEVVSDSHFCSELLSLLGTVLPRGIVVQPFNLVCLIEMPPSRAIRFTPECCLKSCSALGSRADKLVRSTSQGIMAKFSR